MDKHADWHGLQPVHATGRKSPGGGQCVCQRQPAKKARPALREGAWGALMVYVLWARHGRDVANLTAGRDQAGG